MATELKHQINSTVQFNCSASLCMSKCKYVVIFCFLINQVGAKAQVIDRKSNTLKTAGLVAYYFWEEDSSGFIVNQSISKPFLQNFCILRNEAAKCKKEPKLSQIENMITQFAHDDRNNFDRSKFEIEIDDSTSEHQKFGLLKHKNKGIESINYFYKNGVWKSIRRKSVNYFVCDVKGKMRFSHSSDSIVFLQHKINQKANAHYSVFLYRNESNYTERQQIFNYQGSDVTDQFIQPQSTVAIRTLVFANGYRGPKKERDQSDGLLTQNDRYHYWYKIDDQFIDNLKPDASFYMDASFSIKTSNHKNKVNFAWSYLRSKLASKRKRSKRIYKALNVTNNPKGFFERVEQGKRAAEVFLLAKCYVPNCSETRDTVDIVCHSMGYAYSLGFIEALKDKVVFGKLYIIAPEGADVAGADWSLFQEVWQYGSNLGEQNQDPLGQQDGITPQKALKNIENVLVGGRVFIPADWPNKDFVESHMIYSYQWIFERLKLGDKGFVHKN
jgi:hypothetical protein